MNLSSKYMEQRKVLNRIKAAEIKVAEQSASSWSRFEGADITATFDGRVIGSLQSISLNLSREPADLIVLGNNEPRSLVVSRPIEFMPEWPRSPQQ